ncbi:MAG: hypothetical protein ABW157_05830 [Candidatus Thiodiazotropha sp. LLP2]
MPELGSPFLLEEYTLEDLKRYPILVWAEHKIADKEMKYLTPLLNTRNLTSEFNHAKILLTVGDTGLFAEASYNVEDSCIYSLLIWDGDYSVEVEDSDLESPVTLHAVPEIEGEANVAFVLESKEDYYAYREVK